MDKINISIKEKEFHEPHSNVILGEVNNHCVRLAVNEKSIFGWHSHKNSDEVLFVLDGELEIQFLNGHIVILEKLDSLMIPKGIIHKTIAKKRTVNLCFEKTKDSTVFQINMEKVIKDYSSCVSNKKNFTRWYSVNNVKHKNELIWEVNDHCLKFAINSGEYQMHNHPNSDEAFIVINNSITLRLESEEIKLNEMDIYIMTKAINHKPIAANRAGIVFFESKSCETTMK
ncbi:MAG: cupin domain-containing protein [candidate division WOR-3 bacterium]|nr:cupin domain-containing protein [candidate division WOR-3 bacterium]